MTLNPAFMHDGKISYPLIGKFILKQYNSVYHFRMIRENRVIWRYNQEEGVFQDDGEDIIKSLVQMNLEEYSKKYIINEVVNWFKNLMTKKGIVKSDIEYLIDAEDFTSEPKYIGLQNGVFDLEKHQLNNFSYKYKLTTKLPIEYKEKAKSSKFTRFINELLSNQKDMDIIQEMFGYCLWREYRGSKAFILWGTGANGKSTLMEVLIEMLGHKNVSSVSMENISGGHKFMSIELFGKLANVSIEMEKRTLTDTSIIKKATGRDLITGEKKNQDPMQFYNHAKLIFALNKVPISKDTSVAFYRRWIPIEFNNRFIGSNCDPELDEKLKKDHTLSAVFNWSLEGLKRLKDNNWNFTGGWNANKVKDWWFNHTSHVYRFITSTYEQNAKKLIDKKDAYQDYENFCNDENIPPLDYTEFCKKMLHESPYIIREKTKLGKRKWIGIKKQA